MHACCVCAQETRDAKESIVEEGRRMEATLRSAHAAAVAKDALQSFAVSAVQTVTQQQTASHS